MAIAKTIEQRELKHLVEANASRDVLIVAVPGQGHDNCFKVQVKYGTVEKTVARQRGGLRIFRGLDSAARYVRRDLNFARPLLDMSDYRLEAA